MLICQVRGRSILISPHAGLAREELLEDRVECMGVLTGVVFPETDCWRGW